jgi:hypothetical protein
MHMPKNLEYFVVALFECIFVALGIQALFIGDTTRFNFIFFAMIIAILPVLFEKIMHFSLPFGVKSMVSLALFLHLAGGIMRWYWIYQPFYDKIAHFVSAFVIGLLVFVFFLVLDYYGYKLSSKKILLGIFVITIIFGGLWEIAERTLDIVLKSSYNNGMLDTIGDMIGNCLGILIAMLVANYYLRKVPQEENKSWLLRKQP